MKKTAVLRFYFLVFCILLLSGCKELFHPDDNDEGSNSNPNDGQNGGTTVILSAPAGLSGSISNGYLSISWNPVSGAEWYECLIADSPSGYYQPNLMGQIYGTSYYGYITEDYRDIYIKIRACTNGEQGPLSEYYHLSSGYTEHTFTVYAEARSSESIYLSWSFTGGASYYSVFRSQDSISGSYLQVNAYLTTSFLEDNNLIPGTTYYYRVEAYSASYETKLGESEPIQAVTQQAVPDITAIPLSYNEWAANTLSAGISHYYSFYAIAGTTYHITWDDADDGTRTYTSDVKVSASMNGVTLFIGEDQGYTSPKPVTVSSSGNVTITVEGYSYTSSGSYAVMYY
jgi:hypothetical protein